MRVLSGPARGAKWIAGASNHGCWIGTYERDAQVVLARYLGPGTVMYDIGANVGFFTVLAARRGGEVHAFEPDPANFKVLTRHVSLNALAAVTAHEMAISDRDGTATFSPNGSMGHLAEAGIPVRTVRLDTLLDSGMARPSVIKVDVEGAELEVLRGGSKLLSTYRPVVVISLHGVVDKGIDVDTECLKLLRSLGYTCSRMKHGDWVCLTDPQLASAE